MKKRLTRDALWLYVLPLFLAVLSYALWWGGNPAGSVEMIELPSYALGASLMFSPDNGRLVACFKDSNNKKVVGRIYDVKSHQSLCDLKWPDDWTYGSDIGTPTWSADGKRIATLTNFYRAGVKPENRKILIWDADSGALQSDFAYSPSQSKQMWGAVHFSPDGKTLVGAGNPPALYSAATGKRLDKPDSTVDQSNRKLNETGDLVASRSSEGSHFRVSDTRTKQTLWQPPIGYIRDFSWQGSLMGVWGRALETGKNGTSEENLWLWDGQKHQQLASPIPPATHLKGFWLNPDGKTVAYLEGHLVKGWNSNYYQSNIVVYDALANQQLWRITTKEKLTILDWSPDGKRLVVMVDEENYSPVRIYDKARGILQSEGKFSHSLTNSWSPDSHYWASFSVYISLKKKLYPDPRSYLEIHHFED